MGAVLEHEACCASGRGLQPHGGGVELDQQLIACRVGAPGRDRIGRLNLGAEGAAVEVARGEARQLRGEGFVAGMEVVAAVVPGQR